MCVDGGLLSLVPGWAFCCCVKSTRVCHLTARAARSTLGVVSYSTTVIASQSTDYFLVRDNLKLDVTCNQDREVFTTHERTGTRTRSSGTVARELAGPGSLEYTASHR